MSTLPVEPFSLPRQQLHHDEVFPLGLRCLDADATLADAVGWMEENRGLCRREVERYGTLLLRGFPLRSAEDFDAFITALGLPMFTYESSLSNAVRINHTEKVFSANEAPPSVNIKLHHEMAQTPLYPSKLVFFCRKPAEEGGATAICRSDILWEQLVAERPEFARRCETLGLHYTHTMPAEEDPGSGMGRSWKSTLSVDSEEAAEARLRELGYSWVWQENCLTVSTPRLDAVRDLGDGRKAFFNQLIAAFTGWKDSRNAPGKALTFGDGSPMDAEGALWAAEAAEALIYDLLWEAGDVGILDNYQVMHGRRSFSGTRSVLAALIA